MTPSTAETFAAVLLDFDGTVLDTLELILASYRFTLGHHLGHTPPDSIWLKDIGRPLSVQLGAFARDDAELDAMVETYRDHSKRHHDALAKEFEGVQACLEALVDRVPMALVTSKRRFGVERSFARFDLARYFGAVVTADDVTEPKPAPQPVLMAAEALGVAPERCLMVGDSPHDITAGRRAGATTAAAGWGAFDPPALRASDPDHWLVRPSELTSLVLGSG